MCKVCCVHETESDSHVDITDDASITFQYPSTHLSIFKHTFFIYLCRLLWFCSVWKVLCQEPALQCIDATCVSKRHCANQRNRVKFQFRYCRWYFQFSISSRSFIHLQTGSHHLSHLSVLVQPGEHPQLQMQDFQAIHHQITLSCKAMRMFGVCSLIPLKGYFSMQASNLKHARAKRRSNIFLWAL